MKTIFYIEDDAEQIVLMNYFFKRYAVNAELLTFRDGIEFFDFLGQKNQLQGPYCVLLDVNLPYLNGYEILEKVKASENELIRNIPIVMFSSSHRTSDQEKSLALGAVSYLQKPMDYDDMKAILETLFSYMPSSDEE